MTTITNTLRLINALSGQPDTTILEQKALEQTAIVQTLENDYFVVPPFFDLHFSPLSTKGDFTADFTNQNNVKKNKYAVNTNNDSFLENNSNNIIPASNEIKTNYQNQKKEEKTESEESSSFNPKEIKTEASLVQSEKTNGSAFQRIDAVLKNGLEVKYDHKPYLSLTTKKSDVLGIFAPGIKLNGKSTLYTSYFKTGDMNINDIHYLDFTGKHDLGNLELITEIGSGFGAKTKRWDYGLVRVNHKNFTVEAGVLSKDGLVGDKWIDLEKNGVYAWAGLHNDNLYGSIGNQTNETWALAGVHGLKDIGEFTFAKYDRKTGDIWLRSQIGIGNVDQKFFSVATFDVATDYFVFPPFFDLHFSPVETKGDFTGRVDVKGNARTGKINVEYLVGNKSNGVLPFAIGANTQYNKSGLIKTGFVIEGAKTFMINDNSKISLEARYDGLTKTANFYMIGVYGLK